MTIGEVSDEEAEKIQEQTGFLFFGYQRQVSNQIIRYTYKQHGNAEKEEQRGQIGMNTKQMGKALTTVQNAKWIEDVSKENGATRIKSFVEDSEDNGDFHMVQEASKK